MLDNPVSPPPTQDEALKSLASAAEAARQVYLTALAANPGADLHELFLKEMAAAAEWSEAADKALTEDPGVSKAKSDLDKATASIRGTLDTFKDIVAALQALDGLVKLAATVGKFFV
jgi:hypothetical protein